MSFPANSAWGEDQRARESREADALPSLRTPEDNRRIATERIRTVAIRLSALEQWIDEVEDIAGLTKNAADAEALDDVVVQMRSHLPG